MSNWFMFHHINHQTRPSPNKKHAIILGMFSLLMIMAGSGLVFYVLAAQGFNLLSSPELKHEGFEQHGFFSPSVAHWHDQILAWADEYDLDPLLIATVMQIESCGDPKAVSPAGAHGLFQVMPYHFHPNEDMFDPQTNAQRGLTYLHQSSIKSNGDIKLTLAGYNGGHGQIGRDPEHWPEETRRYVYWGYNIYQEIVLGKPQGKALNAWLRAGGWGLCQAAETRLGLP